MSIASKVSNFFKSSLLSVLLFVITLCPLCGTALAAPELITLHKSVVNMNWYSDTDASNGLSADLSTARFYSVALLVSDDSAENDTEGTMTVTNGGYSFWDNDRMNDVTRSGSHTFRLMTTKTSTTQQRDARFLLPAEIEASFKGFAPVNNLTNFVNFNYSADTELKGANVAFTVPNGNGSEINATVSSDLMSTAEQCSNAMPYIEYVQKDTNTVSLKWRLVKQNEPSTAIKLTAAIKFQVVGIYRYSNRDDDMVSASNIYNPISIAANAEASGDIDFEWSIRGQGGFAVTIVRWYYDSDPNTQYQWMFYNLKPKAADTHLGINYNISAKMIDGKPDYSYAKYNGLGIEVINLIQILDAGFMSNQMTFTVPGVYNIINPYNGEVINTVGESESDTFYLLPVNPQGFQMEYSVQMRDGEDSRVPVFWDETGKGLNGKTIKWNFPEHPDFNGSETVPVYKSVEEQLASFFPYFELTSEDGKFTRLQCRLVQSGDLETVYEADGYYQWGLMIDGFYEDGTTSYNYSQPFHIDPDQRETKITNVDWVFDPIPIGMGNRVWITLSFIQNPTDPNGPGSVNYCWVFDDYPPQGNIQTVENLATSVEENAINMLSENISELNYIKVDDIGEAAYADGEVIEMINDDGSELVGRLNTVSADEDGWYIMKLSIPNELYDNLQNVSTDTMTIYSAQDQGQDEQAQPSRVRTAGVLRASNFKFRAAASSNIDNDKFKILSMNGGKLESIAGTREVLIAGYLKAGVTKMYLGAVKEEAAAIPEPEKPNAREIKDAIESADLIAAALENAVSSDAAASLSDILNAMGEEGLIAYGIQDLDEEDFGNDETGYRFVLLSLDKDISSGDIIYVNLLSGDTYEQAVKSIDSTNGYFVLNLVSMDKIPWLLIDTQKLKQLSLASPSLRDAQLEIVSHDYVVLARVLAQGDAKNIFRTSALKFKFKVSDVNDTMDAYATNDTVFLNQKVKQSSIDTEDEDEGEDSGVAPTPSPVPNPNPDSSDEDSDSQDGDSDQGGSMDTSSHGSSSGCNNFNFNILSLFALALALNFARKHN